MKPDSAKKRHRDVLPKVMSPETICHFNKINKIKKLEELDEVLREKHGRKLCYVVPKDQLQQMEEEDLETAVRKLRDAIGNHTDKDGNVICKKWNTPFNEVYKIRSVNPRKKRRTNDIEATISARVSAHTLTYEIGLRISRRGDFRVPTHHDLRDAIKECFDKLNPEDDEYSDLTDADSDEE